MAPKCMSDMAQVLCFFTSSSVFGAGWTPSNPKSESPTWVVATAARHHATGSRALISGFVTEHDGLFVHTVDKTPMQVHVRGAVVTETVVLPDVWFVPGLTANLVSVSQLTEHDYIIGFGGGACYIKSAASGTIVGKGHLEEDGQYVLDFLKVPLAM